MARSVYLEDVRSKTPSLERKIELTDAVEKRPAGKKQVIRVKKLVELSPPHSNYMGILTRLITTFTEVITFIEAVVLEFQPNL